MGSIEDQLETDKQKGKHKYGHELLVVLVFLALMVCWVVWRTPAGPLGPILAYPFFTHPPASVYKPPLVPDAQSVEAEHIGDSDDKVITYETATAPDAVYQFYEETLTRDGWGGKGYFSKPHLTSEGVTFEWDQLGPNGCEVLGYTLYLFAVRTTPSTTQVRLEITKINPC